MNRPSHPTWDGRVDHHSFVVRDRSIGASLLMVAIPRLPVAVDLVRRLDGVYFLRGEVADALRVSTSTIRRLAVHDVLLAPTAIVLNGTTAIAVYDLATIERLSAHLGEHRSRAGRPRLWSDTERRDRRAAYSALGHRRRRAEALCRAGDHLGADRAQTNADRLVGQLHADHRLRSTELRLPRSGPANDGTAR